MKRVLLSAVALLAFVGITRPAAREAAGVVYTDFANVFTANQRINAGLGINIAPGATGTLSLSDGIFERSRATKLGEWTDVAYSAGNFTVPTACVSPSCSWTVSSGNQTTYQYAQVGKILYMNVRIDGTTIVGAPASLRIAVPGGATVNKTIDSIYLGQVNGTYQSAAFEASAGRTAIWFYSTVGFGAWAASTTNNSINFSAYFEVQ